MNATRLIVWVCIVGLVAYDIFAALAGKQTISAQLREIDTETGGLLRWFMVALFLHLFVTAPWGGWNQ